jgi:ribonuclease G
MQITRQRLRPEIAISTAEQCPCCKGTGKTGPSILLADDMERDLKYLVSQGHRALNLSVNPIVGAYLTKGILNSISKKWKKTYELKTLKIVEDNDAGILEYRFFDAKTEEIIKL